MPLKRAKWLDLISAGKSSTGSRAYVKMFLLLLRENCRSTLFDPAILNIDVIMYFVLLPVKIVTSKREVFKRNSGCWINLFNWSYYIDYIYKTCNLSYQLYHHAPLEVYAICD